MAKKEYGLMEDASPLSSKLSPEIITIYLNLIKFYLMHKKFILDY
jgi:hypothetical protein